MFLFSGRADKIRAPSGSATLIMTKFEFEQIGTGLFCSKIEHFKPVPICSYKKIHADGLISDEEFELRKKAIMRDLSRK